LSNSKNYEAPFHVILSELREINLGPTTTTAAAATTTTPTTTTTTTTVVVVLYGAEIWPLPLKEVQKL
jgi:hypothetical protein